MGCRAVFEAARAGGVSLMGCAARRAAMERMRAEREGAYRIAGIPYPEDGYRREVAFIDDDERRAREAIEEARKLADMLTPASPRGAEVLRLRYISSLDWDSVGRALGITGSGARQAARAAIASLDAMGNPSELRANSDR